jgi:hypothetical protein
MADTSQPPGVVVVNQPTPQSLSTVPVKKGIKTSEFALVVVTNIVLILPEFIDVLPRLVPSQHLGLALVVMNGLYTVARAYVKAHAVGEEARVLPPR